MRIVQVSESAFSVKGHGVHTAFIETTNGLRALDGVGVVQNSFTSADIRHIHTVGPYSLLHLLLGRGRKVVSAHIVPESFVGSLVGARYWLGVARWYLRWFYNRAGVVVAVSDATKQELERMGVRTRIEVVYNMVDTGRYRTTESDRADARKQLGINPDDTVVISNGQVQPRKRVDTFINIAKAHPDMKFIWIGGMPFGKAAAKAAQMQDLVANAPSNVTFTGVVDLDKVRTYLAAGDMFVTTSDQETFGLAIVEAAASGLPVVLRDIHDYDHTFRSYAVMASEEQFVQEVKKLSEDPEHYANMKMQAKLLAERYDSRTIARQLVSVYKTLL